MHISSKAAAALVRAEQQSALLASFLTFLPNQRAIKICSGFKDQSGQGRAVYGSINTLWIKCDPSPITSINQMGRLDLSRDVWSLCRGLIETAWPARFTGRVQVWRRDTKDWTAAHIAFLCCVTSLYVFSNLTTVLLITLFYPFIYQNAWLNLEMEACNFYTCQIISPYSQVAIEIH